MILTVTLNPAIDSNLIVDGLGEKERHLVLKSRKVAGGKGVNVSRVLCRLGTRNQAFVMLGGKSGAGFQSLARRDRIPLAMIRIAAETRTNLTIVERKSQRQIKLNQPGSRVAAADLRRIGSALQKKIRSASIVVFSGSLPPGIPPRFLTGMIRHANRLGKRTVVDTSGPTLAAIKKIPVWLLAPNDEEWRSIGRSAPKAKWVLVSLGDRGAELSGPGIHLRKKLKRQKSLCTIGAGDSLLAGFLHEMLKTNDPEKALAFGLACGAACVMNPPGQLADLKTIRKVLRRQ